MIERLGYVIEYKYLQTKKNLTVLFCLQSLLIWFGRVFSDVKRLEGDKIHNY